MARGPTKRPNLKEVIKATCEARVEAQIVARPDGSIVINLGAIPPDAGEGEAPSNEWDES